MSGPTPRRAADAAVAARGTPRAEPARLEAERARKAAESHDVSALPTPWRLPGGERAALDALQAGASTRPLFGWT